MMHESLEMRAWDQSRLTDDLIDSRYHASIRPGAHEPYHATFGGSDRQANIAMLSSREEDIAALPHEVLVLHGKADQVIPQEVSLRLGNLITHRSEEHTSELQSLMRISYAVICLNKQQIISRSHKTHTH